MHNVGVAIMRAQMFHSQHMAHIKRAAKDNDTVVVVLGSANARVSVKNPFSFDQRAQMIHRNTSGDKDLQHTRIVFVPANDHPDNELWADGVVAAVSQVVDITLDSFTLYGSNKDNTSFYLQLFPMWKQAITPVAVEVNATDIREQYFMGQQTPAFLYDNLHVSEATLSVLRTFRFNPDLQAEYDHYKNEFNIFRNYRYRSCLNVCCGDAVVVVNGKVLMIRRKYVPGKDCLALPGGHKEENESFFDAVIRELKEETCIGVSVDDLKNAEVGRWMFDNPARSQGVTRVTLGVLFDLSLFFDEGQFPTINPSDDASEYEWVDIEDVYTMQNIYDDHASIVHDLVKHYLKD